MTLIVAAPPTYEPERRYILGVVLSEWLGLDWQLRPEERSDVTREPRRRGGLAQLVLPEALFATDPRGLADGGVAAARRRCRGGRSTVARLPVLYGAHPCRRR